MAICSMKRVKQERMQIMMKIPDDFKNNTRKGQIKREENKIQMRTTMVNDMIQRIIKDYFGCNLHDNKFAAK